MRSWASAQRFASIVGCLVLFVSCEDDPDPAAAPSPEATGPYVSVAVDNHFHDIHAENDIQISSDRAFVIKNQGRNLHNVTIPGTDINKDIRPGDELSFDPVGDSLDAGTYDLICRYHDNLGMNGRFTVVN